MAVRAQNGLPFPFFVSLLFFKVNYPIYISIRQLNQKTAPF